MSNDTKLNEINIALASDLNNIHALATAVVSALHSKNKDSRYIFYLLLSGEVDDNLLKKITNCAKGFEECCQINFLNLKDKFNNIDLKSYITYAAYFRIMLPSLLPCVKKIIYIDTDTIIRCDLKELWDFNIDKNYIAAVPNYLGMIINRKTYIKAGFKSMEFYINSGVMLMNLEEWRANNIEQRCLEKIGDKNLCKIDTGDQVIINLICYPNIAFLPCKWNMSCNKVRSYNGYIRMYDIFCSPGELSESYNNPAVFHWNGPNKPWIYYDVPLAHEWFRYYIKTPFCNNHLQRKSSIKGKTRNFIRKVLNTLRNGVIN